MSLKDGESLVRNRVSIQSGADVVRRGRLRWRECNGRN